MSFILCVMSSEHASYSDIINVIKVHKNQLQLYTKKVITRNSILGVEI